MIVHTTIFIGATLVPSAFWFVRNLWLTGNPVYPTHFQAFGHVWLRGWYPAAAMRYSPFYMELADWRALVDTLVLSLDFRLVPIWVAAIAGAWSIGKARSSSDRWLWGLSALCIVNIALYWLVIPYRTQQRFMLHAFGLAAVPLAVFFSRTAIMRWVGVSLLALHLLTPFNFPFAPADEQPPWSLTRIVPNVVEAVVKVPLDRDQLARVLASDRESIFLWTRIGFACGAIAIVWTWARWIESRRVRRAVVAAIASTFVFIGAALWMAYGRGAATARYPRFEYLPAWSTLERLSPPEGSRVAYAGTNLPYYLLGYGMRNRVEYVNVDSHRDWLMHDYHLSAVARGEPATWDTPRPGWDRLRPDYDAWYANLRSKHIDFLVVARAKPEDGPFNLADRERFPIERVWADAHPETFQPVYGVSPPDPRIKVYRVRFPENFARNGAREGTINE